MLAYSPAAPEQAAAVGRAFVDAINAADSAAVAATFAPDVRFQMRPASLGGPSYTGRDAFLSLYNGVKDSLIGAKWTVLDLSPSPGKAWLHCTASAYLSTGEPYHQEYVFMFNVGVDAEGIPRITSFTEFLDSVAIKPLLVLVAEKQSAPAKAKTAVVH